jgi:hypothetical protein
VTVVGAGAAYPGGGGLGGRRFAFTAVGTRVAYRGLASWIWIGRGHPIVPFAHDSSPGCAICDPVIALCVCAGDRPRGNWSGAGR